MLHVRSHTPYIERMTQVTNVAWGRKATGSYWVMWERDGLPETADFATAHAAHSFAEWLDTTGGQPSGNVSFHDIPISLQSFIAG